MSECDGRTVFSYTYMWQSMLGQGVTVGPGKGQAADLTISSAWMTKYGVIFDPYIHVVPISLQ